MSLRNHLVAAVLLFLLTVHPAVGQRRPLPPGAEGPLVGVTELFHRDDATGFVLAGFDPLTYLMPEGPQPGRSGLELVWSGVAWRFASEANRTAFEANPAVYAPRVGAYDAEAMSRGRIVDANPMLYAVREGRLYLFRTDANRARFLADPSIAAKAEERWGALKPGLVQP
jgi:hypothetical protein